MHRCICFIDGGFLSKILNEYGLEETTEYDKLIQRMAASIDLIRTYYYDCRPYVSNPPTAEQQKRQQEFEAFVEKLQRIQQVECRFGRLQAKHASGRTIFVQKGVDVLIGVDLATFAAKRFITHAVLLAGDGDLVPAVKNAKNDGVIVKLIQFQEYTDRTAPTLAQECDIVEKWNKDIILQCCSKEGAAAAGGTSVQASPTAAKGAKKTRSGKKKTGKTTKDAANGVVAGVAGGPSISPSASVSLPEHPVALRANGNSGAFTVSNGESGDVKYEPVKKSNGSNDHLGIKPKENNLQKRRPPMTTKISTLPSSFGSSDKKKS